MPIKHTRRLKSRAIPLPQEGVLLIKRLDGSVEFFDEGDVWRPSTALDITHYCRPGEPWQEAKCVDEYHPWDHNVDRVPDRDDPDQSWVILEDREGMRTIAYPLGCIPYASAALLNQRYPDAIAWWYDAMPK